MHRSLYLAFALLALPCSGWADDAATDARVVFYRMYHIDSDGIKDRIRIGDADVGAVADGDGFVLHRPAGAVVFAIDAPRSIGHLDFPMTLEAGKTYYVALAEKPGSGQSAFNEALGETDVKPNAICAWDWCAASVPEKDALADLKAIRFTLVP
jgi:streptogramin lyase